ncbi:antA/AntB antirepressor family protein [Spirosoma gilvum]
MITLRYTKKNTPYIWASELYNSLKPDQSFLPWFKAMIGYGFKENTEYWGFLKPVQLKSGEVRNEQDWSIKLDMAKSIAMLQNNETGRQIRGYLLTLEQQKEDGRLLSGEQIDALMELAEVMGLFTIQKFLEKEHYAQFIINSKPDSWWSYRAKLIGITKEDIKAIIITYGIKYESMRQSMFHIDRFELVKWACVDLFKALGKSDEYALNMGNRAKAFAKKFQFNVIDDRYTPLSFTSSRQELIIAQIKNYKSKQGILSPF